MKKKRHILAAAGMATVLALTVPTASMADDSTLEIKRNEVGDMAVTYSPTVKGLDLDRLNLSQNYLDLKDQMDEYEELYDQLSTYKSLYNLHATLSTDYDTYMGLMLSGEEANIALAAQMIDGDVQPEGATEDTDTDGNGLNNGQEEALAVEVATMSIEQYGAYAALNSVFSAMGITNPNLSNQQEYDTFIYPIYIAPLALRNGTEIMGVGVDQASSGIHDGAQAMYDGAMMLEGYLELQQLSYEMAVDSLNAAQKKYELGQMSELAYEQAVNDEKIAALNLATMERQVENIKMQLNAFLGLSIDTNLVLADEARVTLPLEDVSVYIDRALANRAEVRNHRYNVRYQEELQELYEEYLGKRSAEYAEATGDLKGLSLEQSYFIPDIEADVRKAYMAVLQKEEAFRISRLEMEDALRQQEDLELNVSLGFVTEATAKGVGVLATQATNAYYTAYRDYLSAYQTLLTTSDIGAASTSGL